MRMCSEDAGVNIGPGFRKNVSWTSGLVETEVVDAGH